MGYSVLPTTAAISVVFALILGIVAHVLLKKYAVPAAVLFFIGAWLTISFTFLGALLFLLNGIFALVNMREPLPASPGRIAAYPPPPPLYPPYPYRTQAVPPPQHPYGAYPPQAAQAPIVNNIKEEP